MLQGRGALSEVDMVSASGMTSPEVGPEVLFTVVLMIVVGALVVVVVVVDRVVGGGVVVCGGVWRGVEVV